MKPSSVRVLALPFAKRTKSYWPTLTAPLKKSAPTAPTTKSLRNTLIMMFMMSKLLSILTCGRIWRRVLNYLVRKTAPYVDEVPFFVGINAIYFWTLKEPLNKVAQASEFINFTNQLWKSSVRVIKTSIFERFYPFLLLLRAASRVLGGFIPPTA